MPLFNYACTTCGETKRRLCSVSQSASHPLCPKCEVIMARAPTGPTTQKKERLDNGVSPKAIERLDNAEELFRERAKGKAE